MQNDRYLLRLIVGALDQSLKAVSIICGGATLIFMTGFSVWNMLIMRKAVMGG